LASERIQGGRRRAIERFEQEISLKSLKETADEY
jgi:hypothetical protein